MPDQSQTHRGETAIYSFGRGHRALGVLGLGCAKKQQLDFKMSDQISAFPGNYTRGAPAG